MGSKIEISSLPSVLVFLVREGDAYSTHRRWGAFDSLQVRALDDLYFAPEESAGAVYSFSVEPPHSQGIISVAVPLQLALERVYFHASEPERLVINPRGALHHAAFAQQQLEFSTPSDFESETVILRDEIPELLGALVCPSTASGDPLLRAEKALCRGSFFESFYLARMARERGAPSPQAWFYELFSFSFFGKPDDVLALYEEYPERGSSEPHAQLLAARYRLLLNQLNEARTILHTLSYDKGLGALASSELARSFLKEKMFARAIDGATAAIAKDPALIESYLLRGMAQRGISYESGDQEGLMESYRDFERVAKNGGYNAAEALYHAGTVSARLGALPQAEELFRQSLFQRSRTSPRDALIRVLSAQGRSAEALREFEVLQLVAPNYIATVPELKAFIEAERGKAEQQTHAAVTETSGLWSESYDRSVQSALELLTAWNIPIKNDLTDCAMLDDLINRFAPDGDFPRTGQFSQLSPVGHDVVARVFALHLGALLVGSGGAEWKQHAKDGVVLLSKRDGLQIPLENFVKDRILLGASGDNFSSLDSLVIDITRVTSEEQRYQGADWWARADEATQLHYAQEVEWVKGLLTSCGVELTGTLSDLESIDRWIDKSFEPGGGISEGVQSAIGGDVDRFISATGLLVAETISARVPTTWFAHERAEGVSVVSGDLGRIFPIARLQRRVYLASAADFSTKLGGLAWSAAVASMTAKIRAGTVAGREQVRQSLIQELPSIGEFPEQELSGVIDSLLIGATLASQ